VDAPTYSTPLLALNAVVLHIETTGLDARSARVIRVGAVRLAGGTLDATQRFDRLIHPGAPIPKAAISVHNITDAMVAGAPRFADVAAAVEAFIGRSTVVGHAVAYDVAVLRREFELAGRPAPRLRALDVRVLARIAAPSLADYGLDRLCEWLGIEVEGRHTALGGAEAVAKVFLALVPLLRACNIRTLAEAEAAARRLGEIDARQAGGFATDGDAHDMAGPLAQIDSFPYRHRVADVMSAPARLVGPETTVGEVMRMLIAERLSSVFVSLPSGEAGIATERDVLRALEAGGAAARSRPVSEIMKAPLQTVGAQEFIYRAIGRMERLGFRHLGVRNGTGAIVGAVTTRNLLRHRATTAIVLGDEIDSATSSAALAAAWAKLAPMARRLVAEEVEPRMIAAVVSAEICAATRRAAELAEERMRQDGHGSPPVAFAIMVLGSAGRGESQLAADQDNAIVYATGAEGGPEDRYFEALASHMNQILDQTGIHLCKGGVMAKNKAWRQDVAGWKAAVDSWVRRQRPEDLLNVDIFFDAIPVHGDAGLAEAIWSHAYDRGQAAVDFQKLLTEVARERGSPFTLLGGFRRDAAGRIDLKKYGLMPIFTAARVLSIRHGVRARSTRERLEGVAAKGHASDETVRTILDAHSTILGAVIAQQLADAEAGVPLTPKVAVARLGKPEKAELKSALSAVDEAIELVSEGRV
jgi:DNA polymerase-3 subunit epsilon/CBS domain-containing protein